MPNFFYSVGYGVEKVRSGIVAYPCDLWTEDERKPVGPSLGYLRNILPGGYDTTVTIGRGTASI
jgi:hypothetical protein